MISYFSFGQEHAHRCNGHTLDKDVIVKIEHENPRAVMEEHFGRKWGFEYNKLPDMRYFPRGIYNLTTNKWE